jgi:predicted transcriptional regulator
MIDLVNKIKGVKPVQFSAYKPVGQSVNVLDYMVKSKMYKSCAEIGEALGIRNQVVSNCMTKLFRHNLVVRTPVTGARSVRSLRYLYKSA